MRVSPWHSRSGSSTSYVSRSRVISSLFVLIDLSGHSPEGGRSHDAELWPVCHSQRRCRLRVSTMSNITKTKCPCTILAKFTGWLPLCMEVPCKILILWPISLCCALLVISTFCRTLRLAKCTDDALTSGENLARK